MKFAAPAVVLCIAAAVFAAPVPAPDALAEPEPFFPALIAAGVVAWKHYHKKHHGCKECSKGWDDVEYGTYNCTTTTNPDVGYYCERTGPAPDSVGGKGRVIYYDDRPFEYQSDV